MQTQYVHLFNRRIKRTDSFRDRNKPSQAAKWGNTTQPIPNELFSQAQPVQAPHAADIEDEEQPWEDFRWAGIGVPEPRKHSK